MMESHLYSRRFDSTEAKLGHGQVSKYASGMEFPPSHRQVSCGQCVDDDTAEANAFAPSAVSSFSLRHR